MNDKSKSSEDAIIIKKYANRRLYNTATSSYVTLETLCGMVKGGQNFIVQDAKSGEDITRTVLTQIIFEEESKGQNLLPISFLRQLIGFYGDSLGTMVPGYLESTMTAFARNQDQIRQHLNDSMGVANPFQQIEELGRQNMAVFQQAMGMFTPFAGVVPGAAAGTTPATGTAGTADAPKSDGPQPDSPKPDGRQEARPAPEKSGSGSELDRLQQQLAQMQQQLDRLSDEE
ncbi:MAG: polyhydroxyalkanoate synthesis repressor PhaR [Alphaproteobacteria bacterium]|nr:polyhydroxyalkanoate synthesis repressor PhaR [Alphaproteobacteria bacterium]